MHGQEYVRTDSMIETHKRVVLRFVIVSGTVQAQFQSGGSERENLHALCHMAGSIIERLAQRMNDGAAPSQLMSYRKLKAMAALASVTWQKTKKPLWRFMEDWMRFHGQRNISECDAGKYCQFQIITDGGAINVTYMPVIYDKYDRYELVSVTNSGAKQVRELIAREETIAEGGILEMAKRLSGRVGGAKQQCLKLTA